VKSYGKISNLKLRGGSALILVLIITVVLASLIFSFAFEAHLELKYASFVKKKRQSEALALSGLEVAKMLILRDRIAEGALAEEDDVWFGIAKGIQQGFAEQHTEILGDGEIEIHIIPERGRRNINEIAARGVRGDLSAREDLEIILDQAGIPERFWEDMWYSLMDWVTPEGVSHSKGAKTSDYYSKLTPPYKIKGELLGSVRELKLIRGWMSEALFTGGVLEEAEMFPLEATDRFKRPDRFADTNAIFVTGFEHLFTIYGDDKVNVNSASREVLMTLPGIDEVSAGAIEEERNQLAHPEDPNSIERSPFLNEADLFSRVPGIEHISGRVSFGESGVYKIFVIGRVGRVERKISTIVGRAAGRQPLTFYEWREEN